jgi:hypothetical protein
MKYENYKNLKVHFTGSIAFYFSDILRQVANDKGNNCQKYFGRTHCRSYIISSKRSDEVSTTESSSYYEKS